MHYGSICTRDCTHVKNSLNGLCTKKSRVLTVCTRIVSMGMCTLSSPPTHLHHLQEKGQNAINPQDRHFRRLGVHSTSAASKGPIKSLSTRAVHGGGQPSPSGLMAYSLVLGYPWGTTTLTTCPPQMVECHHRCLSACDTCCSSWCV